MISKLQLTQTKTQKNVKTELKFDKNEQLQLDIIYKLETIQNSGDIKDITVQLLDSQRMLKELVDS